MDKVLNLATFPLDRPGTAEWKALVARCREDLMRHGMFNLDGLMHSDVVEDEAALLSAKFDSESFAHERQHNIYFQKTIEGLAPDHPALQQFQTANRTLCADQITGSALERLYEWPEFITFLSATMQRPQLHPMADPLARINVMDYRAGQALNWHFDRSEFTTTLLLQTPDQGGAFEYRTDLRSDMDPNYDGVAKMLMGHDPEVQSMSLTPGTLNVFKGKNTAHRVSRIGGKTPRMIAVFSYYETPDVTFTAEERIGFYGRAA